MKTWDKINEKISAGKAVVLTAHEIMDYVEDHGLEQAAKDVDVVTTATFGPMCSSGCFLNFGQPQPKIRMTKTWLDDVPAYAGLAAVDAYLGATEIPDHDPANSQYPGAFRFGGGHVIEKLIRGEMVELRGHSYGTRDYPRREWRKSITLDDLNQALMVNPRNCYQNYNVATNLSDETVYTYLGTLKPHMKNINYSSAGQLSPLLNDPWYRTIGLGTAVWLAGARGHVHSQGTQHAPDCQRSANGVPEEGAGTLGLTADMKQMDARFVRGASFTGYGVSLSLGVGIPIPVLDEAMLKQLCVRDREIQASIIDYSHDYPQKTGKVLGKVSYEDLKKGKIEFLGRDVAVGSLSSYQKALEIAEIVKAEVQGGRFLLNRPVEALPGSKEFYS